ncbi:MAG: VWA domain-containing protein, partial [Oscillospiraceae bacterium]|nr:VWA domain-containing protein [Oscillospiraceae bacterium]
MRKDKFVNPLMLVLSIIGGAAAYVFGEALLNFVAYWPYFLQCALYLLFVTAMCCLIMLISESIHSGNYIMRRNKEFGMTCLKAMAIMLPIAFAVGAVTQLLYGLVGLRIGGFDPDFSGTYVVCDVSGSMLDNDPDMEAVDGMIEYIDGISVRRGGEYLGVIVYSDEIYVLREYELLDSEEDKEELIELIRDTVEYGGGTNIQDALLTAIDQMRDARIKKWPGLVML